MNGTADQSKDQPKRSWWAVLRRTVTEFKDDELGDRAAALTYYGILSLFPALLVLVSVIGIVGEAAAREILTNLQQLAPGSARDVLSNAVEQLRSGSGTGSTVAIIGLVMAMWSASGYVGAFIRASNVVYDVPEGRPLWKVTPLRLGVTMILMVLAATSAFIVVVTGGIAEKVGTALGVGGHVMAVWSVAKWPILVVIVMAMIAILYWATPNAKGRGFRWVTPGSVLALVIWMLASGGFAAYVANFASYNKTYGTLAGVIIFLTWLWITNLAILLGLELDAELVRERAIVEDGLSKDAELYARPRDTRKWTDEERERLSDRD
ncbi:YihY/virulence factor BrkB family protein [Streptomycetaceae bacterium NBC_01309]